MYYFMLLFWLGQILQILNIKQLLKHLKGYSSKQLIPHGSMDKWLFLKIRHTWFAGAWLLYWQSLWAPRTLNFFWQNTPFRATRVKCDDSSHAGAPCGYQQNISIFPNTLDLAGIELGWCLWKNSSALWSNSIQLGCFQMDHWLWF